MTVVSRRVLGLVVGVISSACATQPEPSDERDDSFIGDGKADAFGVSTHSYEADAVVALVSSADFATLSSDVGLGDVCAHAIVDARARTTFATLFDVDAVPYTGQVFFTRTLAWVRSHALVGSCGDGVVQPSVETCEGALDCDACHVAGAMPLAALPAHGRPVIDQTALSDGSVAIVTRGAGSDIDVLRVARDGTIQASTVFTTSARESSPHLIPRADGKLGLTFEGFSLTVQNTTYTCTYAGGCGFLFTFAADGTIEAGAVFQQQPHAIPLASGDWILETAQGNKATMSLLDGPTLEPKWTRTDYFDTSLPVGPYVAGDQSCVLLTRQAQFSLARSSRCRDARGQITSDVAVAVSDSETLIATRDGILAVSPTEARALTPGLLVPASIPFAVMPLSNPVLLGDGRLLTLVRRDPLVWITLVGADGAIEWEYPTVAGLLSSDSGVVLARTDVLPAASFPGLAGPFPAWDSFTLVLAL